MQDSNGWCYIKDGYWVNHDSIAKDSLGTCIIGTDGYWTGERVEGILNSSKPALNATTDVLRNSRWMLSIPNGISPFDTINFFENNMFSREIITRDETYLCCPGTYEIKDGKYILTGRGEMYITGRYQSSFVPFTYTGEIQILDSKTILVKDTFAPKDKFVK